LGIDIHSIRELIPQLEHGFPFKVLLNIESQTGIPVQQFAEVIGITPRTFARRRKAGRMTLEESERILRISTVFEKAVRLFGGDKAAAAKWFTTPRKYFSNHSPLQYSRTEVGAREVENLIGRLEHGVIA
jgi:putative toxin-antitoxin system antitoxin component (TIGR02293 family)